MPFSHKWTTNSFVRPVGGVHAFSVTQDTATRQGKLTQFYSERRAGFSENCRQCCDSQSYCSNVSTLSVLGIEQTAEQFCCIIDTAKPRVCKCDHGHTLQQCLSHPPRRCRFSSATTFVKFSNWDFVTLLENLGRIQSQEKSQENGRKSKKFLYLGKTIWHLQPVRRCKGGS